MTTIEFDSLASCMADCDCAIGESSWEYLPESEKEHYRKAAAYIMSTTKRIPHQTMSALQLYFERGLHPGNFLHAVLCNDLRGACTLGTLVGDDKVRNIPAIVEYLYGPYTPISCWGSPERVAAWIAQHAAQREGTSS